VEILPPVNTSGGYSQKPLTNQHTLNASTDGENNSQPEIDREIQKLAARLEALRAARAKLNS